MTCLCYQIFPSKNMAFYFQWYLCFLPVLFLLYLLLYILYFIAVAYIVTRISVSISSVGGYLGDNVFIFEHFLLFGHLDKLPY